MDDDICNAIAEHIPPETILEMMHLNNFPITHRFEPWRNTILHKAAAAGNSELISHLNSLNFDFNIQDDLGQTALFVCKDLQTIKCIVECGANINIKDDRDVTAICNYLEWGMTEEGDYLKSLGISLKNLEEFV